MNYRDWNEPYGVPGRDPALDEAEARRCFDGGVTVPLLMGDETHPDVVARVELGGAQIQVTWLDALSRPVLNYLFTVEDGHPDDRLFLEQVRMSGYDHDTPLPDGLSTYDEAWYFKPDGSFWAIRGGRDEPSEESRGRLDEDQLALQWEPRPAFGDWAGVLRRER